MLSLPPPSARPSPPPVHAVPHRHAEPHLTVILSEVEESSAPAPRHDTLPATRALARHLCVQGPTLIKEPCIYILASRGGTIHIGVTSDLQRRVYEHREGLVPGFTSRYNVTRLEYFEAFPTMLEAIAREKQLKGWRREKKVALIEAMNPRWRDLSDDWRHAG